MFRNCKNVLVYSIHDRELKRAAQTYFRGNLIDIGCGDKPYANMVEPYVSRHIGIDHLGAPHHWRNIDAAGLACALPIASDYFDSALCTAVLEHVEEPELAVRECCRVLKRGGIAVFTAPFIWHLHESPRDFYRFSKYGLNHLFCKAGFDVLEIRALSGFWVTFGQLFVYVLYRCHRGPLRFFPVIPALSLIVQGLAFVLNAVDRTEQWTWMYLVVARRR